MLAKDRLADLAEQGAAVVATKSRNAVSLSISLNISKSIFSLGVLSFCLSCSVDLSTSTPGAQAIVCTPSAAQLTAFAPINTGILQQQGNVGVQQGCANCHIQGVGTPPNAGTGAGSFRMLNGSTAEITLANYCTAYSRRDVIAIHPTQATHAQVYAPSDLSQLSAWVATF